MKQAPDGTRKLRAMLVEAGITQTEIARFLDVTPQAVNNTIARFKPSKRVVKAIALKLGKTEEEIGALVYGDSAKRCEAANFS